MGVSENSVPLNPMVNDHYPYQMAIIGNIPYFQTNPHGGLRVRQQWAFSLCFAVCLREQDREPVWQKGKLLWGDRSYWQWTIKHDKTAYNIRRRLVMWKRDWHDNDDHCNFQSRLSSTSFCNRNDETPWFPYTVVGNQYLLSTNTFKMVVFDAQSCLLPLSFLLQLTKAVLCAPDKWLKRDRLGIMRAPYEIVVMFFDVEWSKCLLVFFWKTTCNMFTAWSYMGMTCMYTYLQSRRNWDTSPPWLLCSVLFGHRAQLNNNPTAGHNPSKHTHFQNDRHRIWRCDLGRCVWRNFMLFVQEIQHLSAFSLPLPFSPQHTVPFIFLQLYIYIW